MKRNIGTVDRVIRIVVGAAALALGIVFKSPWGLIGLIPLGTAAVGTCPIYLPLGISTGRKS